ncbi:MAG: adenosine deaminase [Anaerolineales bacterium]|nr:adenosine deaminase [Anaerolineales bacterium]
MTTTTDTGERLPPLSELHLHLEGAIPLPALWELICKYGGDPTVPDLDALQRRFTYKDFPHFIQTWIWKNGFLREYEDFAFIAERVARDLQNQNILNAEAHYSPSGFVEQGLDIREITRAIRSGLDRVKGIEVALIADLIRDLGPESAARTLKEVSEVRGYGVVGIGLGGSEQSFPPELFTSAYADARRSGFHTTAHAGEAAGAASIWGALRRLGVERIGHGTRAEEDPELMDYLAEKQVPVEMCPLSNIRTGVVGRIEDHPFRRYFDRGLMVTVSTDDPKMFGNSLAEEYRILETVFQFTQAELRQVRINSIKASWMDAEKKQRLLA